MLLVHILLGLLKIAPSALQVPTLLAQGQHSAIHVLLARTLLAVEQATVLCVQWVCTLLVLLFAPFALQVPILLA